MVPERTPRVPDAQDTMMLIIGVQGEIVGITRLIKYLFLACQNGALRDPPDIGWRSHYYGPYWDGVNGAIGSLVKRNLVSTVELKNDMGRTTRYSITDKGRSHCDRLVEKLGKKEVSKIAAIVRAHQHKPLVVFLDFIYRKYPEYREFVITDRIRS